MPTAIEKAITGEVDVETLLSRLDFQLVGIQDAAQEQAKLFVESARIRVAKMRSRNQMEAMLAVKKTTISMRLRKLYKQRGEKLTEAHLLNVVESNPEYQELAEKLHRCEEEEEFTKLLVEGFRMRRDALKVVSELANAEFRYGIAVAGKVDAVEDVKKIKQRLRSKYPGNV